MFTWISNFKLYKFIKSGMLIDYFFKKLVYYKLQFLFIIYSVKFSEKYYIEYSFLKLNRYITFIQLILNFYNLKLIVHFLVVILNSILFYFILINLWLVFL